MLSLIARLTGAGEWLAAELAIAFAIIGVRIVRLRGAASPCAVACTGGKRERRVRPCPAGSGAHRGVVRGSHQHLPQRDAQPRGWRRPEQLPSAGASD